MGKVYLDHQQVGMLAATAAALLSRRFGPRPHTNIKMYAIPRGGVPVAYLIAGILTGAQIVETPEQANVIIDDLIDSGKTMDCYLRPDKLFVVLLRKDRQMVVPENVIVGGVTTADRWIVFPWEGSETGSADDIGLRLLQFVGEDPNREGLRETPARFLRAWKHYCRGYQMDPADVFKVFEDGAENCDEMVIVRDIPFYSHCEHHLTIIAGKAHVGYLPNGKIIGLSKIARLVDIFACRLQVQERLGNNIADAIQAHLDPLGVAVVLEAEHFCMTARGVEKPGTTTVTSATRGSFRSDPACRAEFFSLVNRK